MQSPTRRSLIGTVSGAVTLALVGCTDRGDTFSDPDPSVTPEFRSGESAAVAIEVRPGAAESGRIRRVAQSEVTATDVGAVWGTNDAAEHAAEYVQSMLAERSLSADAIGVGWGKLTHSERPTAVTPPSENEYRQTGNFGVFVRYSHRYDREGDLVQTPTVDFESVVEATPTVVYVAVHDREHEYTATVPVVCERRAVQEE